MDESKKSGVRFPEVSIQQLLDVGLNAFAVQLLAESYALHPNPRAIAFCYKAVKDGKPIKVFVRLDPEEPMEELAEGCFGCIYSRKGITGVCTECSRIGLGECDLFER